MVLLQNSQVVVVKQVAVNAWQPLKLQIKLVQISDAQVLLTLACMRAVLAGVRHTPSQLIANVDSHPLEPPFAQSPTEKTTHTNTLTYTYNYLLIRFCLGLILFYWMLNYKGFDFNSRK